MTAPTAAVGVEMTRKTFALRVAIVGSRDFTDAGQMMDVVSGFPKGTTIVSGGAVGADSIAETCAARFGLGFKAWLPDLDRYGNPRAYFLRNRQIVADCDRVIAFFGPNGVTPGTKHTVTLAMEQRKPIAILFQRP